MESHLKIQLVAKKTYHYGIEHSGFSLFDQIRIENEGGTPLSSLRVVVKTTPNILLKSETVVSFLAPLSYRFLSCDFIELDSEKLIRSVPKRDILINVSVFDSDGERLASLDSAVCLLPYSFFSGFHNMPEAISFFVTPAQPEVQAASAAITGENQNEVLSSLYEYLKSQKITYHSENYFSSEAKNIHLPEETLIFRHANSLELALVAASVLENKGYDPLICASPKGKIFCGVKGREKGDTDKSEFLSYLSKSDIESDRFIFLDAAFCGYGSELGIENALYNTKNALLFSDERLLLIDISACRAMHLLPLPNRVDENGCFMLSLQENEEANLSFSRYYDLFQKYSSDSRIMSVLTGQKLYITSQKNPVPFDPRLDVNQNKILNKILNNDFTLVKAQHGTGASTLLAAASRLALKANKSVLYITDSGYNSHDFADISSRFFDSAFTYNFSGKENEVFQKESFSGIFSDSQKLYEQKSALKELFRKADSYYENLEGAKRIVNSFCTAAERYSQYRDANDCVVFSPEQIGLLSDDMVREWFAIITDMTKAVSETKGIHQNPLQLVRNKNFSYEFKSKLLRRLEEFLRLIENIQTTKDQIQPFLTSLGALSSLSSFNAFVDLIRIFLANDKIPAAFFAKPDDIEENFQKITKLIQAKNENDSIRKSILVSFNQHIFDLDAESVLLQWNALIGDKSLRGISSRHSILKNIKRFLRPNCDVENIEFVLSSLSDYHKNSALISQRIGFAQSLIGVDLEKGEDQWEILQNKSEICYQVSQIFRTHFEIALVPFFISEMHLALQNEVFRRSLDELIHLQADFCDVKASLQTMLCNDMDQFYPSILSRDADYHSSLYQNINSVMLSLDNLKPWCAWLGIRDRAGHSGLKNITLALENGRLRPDEIKRSFVRAFFKGICEYNFIAHPELTPSKFDFDSITAQIESLWQDLEKSEKAELDAFLSLEKLEALSRFHETGLTFSDIAENTPELLQKIYPVLISDFETAKKVFSETNASFDYIFVESRSRINICDFIWTMAAAKKTVLIGNFCQSISSDNKSIDLTSSAFDYLWQITEEKYSLSCVYKSSPKMTAVRAVFAEGERSDARCYAVPNPAPVKPCRFVQVNGFYSSDYPRANFREAEKAVALVVEKAKTESASFGIVTSTSEQKKLVVKLLAQKILEDEILKSDLLKKKKRIDVFSIEDEFVSCDYLYYSFTFAPDKRLHTASLPFDFISGVGIEAKLLFEKILSAANKEFTLLMSFDPDELKFTQTVFPAVFALDSLISLCEKNPCNIGYEISDILPTSNFIKRLALELNKNGFSTCAGIQSGRFYLDLAVLNEKGEFCLGILSDQSVLVHNSNIFAIELANKQRFEQNGWQLFRLRSPECFDSFEHELDHILRILNPDFFQNELI